MKLKDLVPLMNIWELYLGADSKSDLDIYGELPMFPNDKREQLLEMYGDHEVAQVTNICRIGVTIWIF